MISKNKLKPIEKSKNELGLDHDTANAYDSISNDDSDSESDLDDSNLELTVGSIIGINKPKLTSRSPQLLFYVRINNKSYKSCRWATKEEVCQTQRGTFLYNLYVSKHSSFQPFPQFKANKSFSSNESFNLYLPFNSNFDEGYITPEFIVSSRKTSKGEKYLVKWLSLDIQQSSWEKEDEIPFELINEFKQRNKNTHSTCYSPTNSEKDPKFKPFKNSPIFKNGNKLTDYQVDGLNWLQMSWFQRKNSILSDEMGLGKTIESISILDFLSKSYSSWGPFLVVCPLSTVTNWLNEFKKWTDYRVVSLVGDKESRKVIKENMIFYKNSETNTTDKSKVIFDVLVVSYEWLNTELKFIKQFNFMYTIIDEAQRIKNSKTSVYQNCQAIQSYHFLLMTGTPIQNNLYEIWSLLHFIEPSQFVDYDEFESFYSDKENPETIQKLQEVLQPYIFRRKKNDVNLNLPEKEEIIIEVEMTQMQRTFSQLFYKDNLGVLNESLKKLNLNNIMIQLRKLYCHPFLFPNFESMCHSQYKETHNIPHDVELSIDDEMKSLILASGKTILIDKLLPKLKEGNHKVLFFSQFTSVLDILEDYLTYKCYPYERLDGSCNTNDRMRSIDKFQKDQESFVFLLSTRAGGLGINLTKADTVIIYDSDWNPQNDIQAQARCHRIGQSNKVCIYRLVTSRSYESEMFLRASKKLALDYAILDSAAKTKNRESFDNKKELEMILKKGAYYTFNDDSNEIDKFCSENIDQILKRRSYTRKDVVSGGNSKFSKVCFNTITEEDANKTDFWDTLVGSGNESEHTENTNSNSNTQIVTRKKKQINYSDTHPRIKQIKLKESQNIIHITPEINENDSDLEDLKLTDFCDLDSFTKKVEKTFYDQAFLVLRNGGIGSSRSKVCKTIHDISKTLLICAFFGMPTEYRKYYYSYVKQFIPNFSKQISKTPYKIIADKFINSIDPSIKLTIIEETFNWDIIFKVVLYITNEKLPENFQFAPEMQPYKGWTPFDDFNVMKSFQSADKRSSFINNLKLPSGIMILKDNSTESWIFTRLKLIYLEIYSIIPKDFSIYESDEELTPKKIGSAKQFYHLNYHVIYPKGLSIHVQKKLLRILYFYGIPEGDKFSKIAKILDEDSISEDLILLFTAKIIILSLKYQPELIDVLRSLPKFDLNAVHKNEYFDTNWIKETAITAVASNIYLIDKVRKNRLLLKSVNFQNIEKKLGKWKEIINKCNWWDFQCDIVMFNVTAFYGFLFNSMLCHHLTPNKPRICGLINEDDIVDWREQEILNAAPITIKKAELLEPVFAFEAKKKRICRFNDLIEKLKNK